MGSRPPHLPEKGHLPARGPRDGVASDREDAPDRALVFDAGGTTLRSALFDARGDVLVREDRRATADVQAGADPVERLLDALVEAAEEVVGGERFGGVGIAFPGPVAPGGVVQAAPTLWGERLRAPVALLERARARWPGRCVEVVNDVTAAGHRYAPREGVFCIVNVGSGIGHKVFVDGEAIVGPRGRGGEIGHWVVDRSASAPACDCGGRGHVGALASGRSSLVHVQRIAERRPDAYRSSPLAALEVTNAEQLNERLARAFRAQDPFAQEVVAALAEPLGQALAAVHVAIGVEDFVLVGGLARALGSAYLAALAASAAEACWTSSEDWEQMLRPGAPDDDSGLIGMGRRLTRAR